MSLLHIRTMMWVTETGSKYAQMLAIPRHSSGHNNVRTSPQHTDTGPHSSLARKDQRTYCTALELMISQMALVIWQVGITCVWCSPFVYVNIPPSHRFFHFHCLFFCTELSRHTPLTSGPWKLKAHERTLTCGSGPTESIVIFKGLTSGIVYWWLTGTALEYTVQACRCQAESIMGRKRPPVFLTPLHLVVPWFLASAD